MHQVRTLPIVVRPAESILLAGRHPGYTIKGLMPLHRIFDILTGCRTESLAVAVLQCRQRRILGVAVARQQRSVVRAFMMVCAASNSRVQAVNGIGAGKRPLVQMRRPIRLSAVAPNDVEGVGGRVTGVPLPQAASATGSVALVGAGRGGFMVGWRSAVAARAVAGGDVVVKVAEDFGAVVGKFLRPRTSG